MRGTHGRKFMLALCGLKSSSSIQLARTVALHRVVDDEGRCLLTISKTAIRLAIPRDEVLLNGS